MTPKHRHKKYLLLILLMFFTCVATAMALSLMPSSLEYTQNAIVSTTWSNPFGTESLEARSVYIYDVAKKKVIYEKNSEEVRPLASIAKVMTGFTALDFYTATSTIAISKRALSSEGDTGLLSGEIWKFRDLLNLTMLTSSNDGATALAIQSAPKDILADEEDASTTEAKFVDKMNANAAMLGLSSLKFNNVTGLDLNPAISGAYGSAKDIGLLFARILETHPEVLEITKYDDHAFTSLNGITHFVHNTDTAVNKIPGILASKTGYTDLAGGNLAIAFDIEIGHPIVIVVLGSSYEGRFDDVITLASSTRAFYFQH